MAIRVRADFVTRPPRLDADDLAALWREQASRAIPVVDPRRLIELKKTNREKDCAVIGELARLLVDPRQQLLAPRSARDLAALNDVDRYTYSHGVFVSAPQAPSRPAPALPPASSVL